MPRNEFQARDHDETEEPIITPEVLERVSERILKEPNKEFRARDWENPEPEVEDLSQEVDPVEDDPHEWPEATRKPLKAGLSRPSLATTVRHIAEIYEAKDQPIRFTR